MDGTGYAIGVLIAYAVVAVGLTAWLARTLYRSGVAFLHDVFADRPALADAVNRLLVTGFYMLNLGYAFFVVRVTRGMDGFDAAQVFVNRLSILLATLGAVHFVNVFVFWRIRARREQRTLPPPVPAQVRLPHVPPPPVPQG